MKYVKLLLLVILVMYLPFLIQDIVAAPSPINFHKPTYFLIGNKSSQAKVQVSTKYALVDPYRTGLFFGYTHYMIWDIYSSSSPFRDVNFNPELFFKRNIKSCKIIDYIMISPYEHVSNGRSGDISRAIDMFYGKISFSNLYHNTKLKIGNDLKIFGYYKKGDQNKDIQKYKGYWKSNIFIKFNDSGSVFNKTEANIAFGLGTVLEKGWVEAGIACTIPILNILPKIYLQVWHGYGESLLEYNIKETAIRAGISYMPN